MARSHTPAGRSHSAGHRPRRAAPGTVAALAAVLGLGLAGGAAFSATGKTSPSTPTRPSTTTGVLSRVAGVDRYATSAALSAAAFPDGASVAYLATGADYPDALSAAAASGGTGPVLLVAATGLPNSVSKELARLGPSRVVVVGGMNAVSASAFASIRSVVPSASMVRIAGVDRYTTAAALSRATFPNGSAVTYLATGSSFPDALTAAASAHGSGPVLLLRPNLVPDSTATELKRLHSGDVRVVGGTAALTSEVLSAVTALVGNAKVSRLSGADRYTTAVALSRAAFPAGAAIAYVATGSNFADALSAAAAAAGHGPVLLIGDTLSSATDAELRRLGINQVVVVGGTDVINDVVASQVQQDTVGPSKPAPPPVSSKAAVAVATARAQLGKPYEWAGAGPDVFDCSGLTRFSWASAGVSLPHNAEAQAEMLPGVAITDLQPGDLVFYGTPGNISHVGLFIGDGQMIEAAHSGVPVRIADIQRPDLVIGGRPG